MSEKIEFRAKVQLADGKIATMRYKTTEDDGERFDYEESELDDKLSKMKMIERCKTDGAVLLEPITKHYV
jgi:hypothetical protein